MSKVCRFFEVNRMRIRYIPTNEAHGVYINLNRLYSFQGFRLFGVIGARGYGKTFHAKRMIIKDHVFDGGNMVVCRDTDEAIKRLRQAKGAKFFGDVLTNVPTLCGHTASFDGSQIMIDGQYAGNTMALPDYYKEKGNFYNVRNFLFDEFIKESVQRYTGNRARSFLNTVENIIRDFQHSRVIMTANSLELGNDILELLGLDIRNGKFGYYINYDKVAIIYYAPDSPEYIERRKHSLAYKLAKGTQFEGVMFSNTFENGDAMIFERRKPCLLIGIYYSYDNTCFRLYKARDSSCYYCCHDNNPQSYEYMRYVFTYDQVKRGRSLADKSRLDARRRLHENHMILFQSNYIYNVFLDVINEKKRKT